MVLFGGLLNMLFGVTLHMRVAPLHPIFSVFGPVMIALGVLSIGACIGLSYLKPWARKTVIGVAIAIPCVHIILGYYQMAAMSALIYWLAISQLKSIDFKADSD